MTRRETIWLGEISAVQAGTDVESYDVIPETLVSTYGKMTVTRVIASLFLENDSASFNNISCGLIVVDEGLSGTDVPNPRTDIDAPWLFRKTYFLDPTTSDNELVCGKDDSAHLDIRSMRKIGRTEKLIFCVDDADGSYSWGADVRVLVKLA